MKIHHIYPSFFDSTGEVRKHPGFARETVHSFPDKPHRINQTGRKSEIKDFAS
jgi:hypothetical protein